MRNFKIILFLLSLFLISDFCSFERAECAGKKAKKEKSLAKKEKKKKKKEAVLRSLDAARDQDDRKKKKKKKKKEDIAEKKEEKKIYAAVRKKVEKRRREVDIRAEVKDVDITKEVEREVLKQKAWNALEKTGAAVHMKEYVKLVKRSENAKDLAEFSTMRANVAESELAKIKQIKGESSDEAVKAQGHFDRLKGQANKTTQESDKIKKDIDMIKETVLLIKLERDAQDSEMNLKDAVFGKTKEEQIEHVWKELDASGIITEAKVKTQQEEIETVRKIEKEEEKIKKLKAKLAKIEKLPKEEQNPFGDVKQALKGDIIKARQKVAGLKTGILKGGEIGKLVGLEKKANKLKGKTGKQKKYDEVVIKKEELEEQLREKIRIAKGISLAEEPLLRAQLKSQVSDFDIKTLEKERDESSTDLDRKKEIEKELSEINESKKFVEDYINQKVSNESNESKKRARLLTDDEVAKIREEIDDQLTNKAEKLKDADTLIDDAKKDIAGEREETKKEVKKMAMTTGMKFVGVFPSIFMTPPEAGAGGEGVEGEEGGGGLTEEQFEMLRKRRMMQVAG